MRILDAAIVIFIIVMAAGMAWNIIMPMAALSNTNPSPNVATTSFGLPNSGHSNAPANNMPTSSGNPGSSTTTSSNTVVANSPNPRNSTAWREEWLSYAEVAWRFFKPGVGVSPTTGLVYASPYWHRFTDWDLAGYIESVLAAEQLGIIGTNGAWGADYRLGLVLNFLDARPLTSNNLWFQFYNSDTGTVSPDGLQYPGGLSDGGPLLIALYDTKLHHPELTSKVDSAVQRVNYSSIIPSTACAPADVYCYYATLGLRLWGFKTPAPPSLSAPPAGSMITAEPVMLAILEHASDAYLNETGREVYSAQYAAYNRTGQLVALSEGQYPPYLNSSTPYVYEMIEVPSGSSYQVYTWQGKLVNSSPEAFTKLGFAFYAIYKSSYGLLLVKNLGNLTTSNGYEEGVLTQTGQIFGAVADNTNIMVMEACAYAVESA